MSKKFPVLENYPHTQQKKNERSLITIVQKDVTILWFEFNLTDLTSIAAVH